jgi:hypothetical protein
MTSVPPAPGDDVVEHLWNAAHELLRAVRKMVDVAEEFVDQQRQTRDVDPEPRLHHIDIDADTQ